MASLLGFEFFVGEIAGIAAGISIFAAGGPNARRLALKVVGAYAVFALFEGLTKTFERIDAVLGAVIDSPSLAAGFAFGAFVAALVSAIAKGAD